MEVNKSKIVIYFYIFAVKFKRLYIEYDISVFKPDFIILYHYYEKIPRKILG